MTFDETEAYNKPDSTEVAYYKDALEKHRKELASLRERLKLQEEINLKLHDAMVTAERRATEKATEEFEEQLKQKEDENRELIKYNLKAAFGAGMYRATFNGRPGYQDAPDFDEWYENNYTNLSA